MVSSCRAYLSRLVPALDGAILAAVSLLAYFVLQKEKLAHDSLTRLRADLQVIKPSGKHLCNFLCETIPKASIGQTEMRDADLPRASLGCAKSPAFDGATSAGQL